MYNLIAKYKKITAFVAGALSVLVFAPYFQLWAGFISFSLLVYLLIRGENWKENFKTGYAFGFAHFALGFSWIGNALLIDVEKFGWLYPIVLIASGGFFGLFTAFPAALSAIGCSKFRRWFIFCGAWVVFEWIRSFFLTGFPWNLLGYSWGVNLPLMQNAAIGGVYLTSLLAIAVYSIGGVWLYERKRNVLVTVLLIIVLVSGFAWGGGAWRLHNAEIGETSTLVRIVQPSIPQSMKWTRETAEDNFQDYVNLSASNTEDKPDWIVWGETASPFRLGDDEFHRRIAASVLPEDSILITGVISYHYNKGRYLPHNSMAVIDDNGEIKNYYHKTHLVPFGEYIPLRKYLPEFVRPVANAIGEFGRGEGASVFRVGNNLSFGGAICYEIIFPGEVVNKDNRPDVIINLTNDGWYGDSAGPYQHWITAKFRAVEEGIPVIRAANNGISGMINAYGEEKGVLSLNYSGVTDVKLEKSLSEVTFYGKHGNITVIILCLLLVLTGAIKPKED